MIMSFVKTIHHKMSFHGPFGPNEKIRVLIFGENKFRVRNLHCGFFIRKNQTVS